MVLQAPARADSVPFWGAKASVPIDTPIKQLSIDRRSMTGRQCPTWSGSPGAASRCMPGDCLAIPNLTAAFTCQASSQRLFDISPNGMTVVIGTEQTAPEQVAHPGYLAPVKFVGGQPVEPEAFTPKEDERWQPELSPSGPVSIVLSQASQLIVV